MEKKKKELFVQAKPAGGAWTLKKNTIWNIPEPGIDEVRFEYKTEGPWHNVKSLSGLAVTLRGKVFGIRSLIAPREDGYNMKGRVSIGGKKYPAFTSSRLFEREDKSLCSVGVLVVCRYDKTTDPVGGEDGS